jgi:NitT/TauT family transport system substrate-binding protein
VSDFLDRYAVSVNFVNNNVGEAAELVGGYDIFPVPIARAAIPYCNITFIEGQHMKTSLMGYLRVLYNQNPSSVGGALPSDAFFFSR